MKKSERDAAKAEAITRLREMFPAGSTVYVSVKSVSRSGRSRAMQVLFVHDGEIVDITHFVANATENPLNQDGYLRIGGCGMDMTFALVYQLGSVLFPRRTEWENTTYVSGRNGDTEPEKDGGYCLKKVTL